MAMLEQVKMVALGVVLLIMVVIVFNNMFASPECDDMANITAEQLRDAVDKVAAEDGVQPWTKDKPPEITDTQYYASVPIRLCEDDIAFSDKLRISTPFGEIKSPNEFKFTGGAWAAHLPTYIIVHEEFPKASGFFQMWDEGYPWSGGAVNAVFAYAVIRYGPSLVKLGYKINKLGLSSVFSKSYLKANTLAKLKLLADWWDDILVATGRRQAKSFVDDSGTHKLFRFGDYKDLSDEIAELRRAEGLSEIEAFQRVGIIDETRTTKLVRDPKTQKVFEADVYVVKTENREMMRAVRNNLGVGDEAKLFDSKFYIPEEFGWVETFAQKTRGAQFKTRKFFTDTVIGSGVVGAAKTKFDPARQSFHKYYDNLYYRTPTDNFIAQKQFRQWAQENPSTARKLATDDKNWDRFEPLLQEVAAEDGRRITKTTFTDYDLQRVLTRYEKEFTATPFQNSVGFTVAARSDEYAKLLDSNQIAEASVVDGKFVEVKMKHGMETSNIKILSEASLDDVPHMKSNHWSDVPADKQADITFTFDAELEKIPESTLDSDGVIILLDESYETNRVAAGSANIYEEIATGPASRIERAAPPSFVKRYKTILADEMIDDLVEEPAGQEILTDWILAPRETSGWIPKLNDISKDLGKFSPERRKAALARFIFVDMGRAGIGPAAKYNPFAQYGAYGNRRALEKASEAGGWYDGSIGILTKNKPSSFLLNSSLNVKIWREEYGWGDRIPAFIQTLAFQAYSLEDPRFYLASPCFGFAKVWKKGGTVYVDVEKCDVGDAANYCYADKDYIWGRNDEPKLSQGLAIFFTSFATCKISTAVVDVATGGSGTAATTQTCLKVAGVATTTTIMEWSLKEAEKEGTPTVESNLPEGRKWGYWNFYKAADVCDVIDIASSFAGAGAGKHAKKSAEAGKTVAKQGDVATKVGKTTNKGVAKVGKRVDDFCMVPEIVGDVTLSWPKVTPLSELGKKDAPLTAEIIQEYAPVCAFTMGG
ncbi:MAG: hypothetical protein GOV02_00950 [Candidatus Aenigmarchaeota archaeon]|nr:hypothetical protein [Candidatus Aenigmarchaeota archaeon]